MQPKDRCEQGNTHLTQPQTCIRFWVLCYIQHTGQCSVTRVLSKNEQSEAEDGSIPGLETDESSSDKAEAEPSISTTYVEPNDEEIEQWLDETDTETDVIRPPLVEDEEEPQHNWSIWDPQGNLQKREYEFLDSTVEEVLVPLFD